MSNAGYYLAGIVFVAIGIAVSIALHEFGHMFPAKKFGVKVPRFMVGFGPTLFSRKRGETEFGLKLIPLGGYVTLTGMAPGAEEYASRPVPKNRLAAWYLRYVERFRGPADLEPSESHRAFYRLSTLKKLTVMAGGPIANLVLGVIFAAVVFWGIGVPTPNNQVSEVVACISVDGKVAAKAPASCDGLVETTAHKLGLKAGDRVVSIDGTVVANPAEVRAALADLAGKTVSIVVSRGTDKLNLQATVENAKVFNPETKAYTERPFLGVSFGYERKAASFAALGAYTGETIAGTFAMIAQLPSQALHVIGAIDGTEQRSSSGAVSVVGIAKVAGDLAAENGQDWAGTISMWLLTLSSLNFALFAFNMIPVLPLDGGHIAAALYGQVKRFWFKARGLGEPRPVDLALLGPLTMFGWITLTLMGLLFVIADIVAPVTL
ncbi:MAG: site-2 protease family protein [Actinomycetales bacterium]|nr:site-2 protease family protein [Actinomycetales bacterium]